MRLEELGKFLNFTTTTIPGGNGGIQITAKDAGGSDLLKRADAAMYSSKAKGGSCYHFFEPDMQEPAAAPAHARSHSRPSIEASRIRFR